MCLLQVCFLSESVTLFLLSQVLPIPIRCPVFFWLTSYILVNLTVLVLRRRYPNHPARRKSLVFGGIPQVIAIIGDIYMIINIAEGAQRIFIYQLYFVILAVTLAYAVIWTRFIKKQPMFVPADLKDIEGSAPAYPNSQQPAAV